MATKTLYTLGLAAEFFVQEKCINSRVFKCSGLTELICVPAQAVFARGISAVPENYICVGKYEVNLSFPEHVH